MKIRVVSSKEEIRKMSPNERNVHLAFRPSNVDFLDLIRGCPRLRVVQVPPSYHKTLSKAIKLFLEMQGVTLLEGDVWGHRKDIDEYYEINESIIERLSRLMNEGRKIDEIVTLAKRETKLSEDLIKYILKTCAII